MLGISAGWYPPSPKFPHQDLGFETLREGGNEFLLLNDF